MHFKMLNVRRRNRILQELLRQKPRPPPLGLLDTVILLALGTIYQSCARSLILNLVLPKNKSLLF